MLMHRPTWDPRLGGPSSACSDRDAHHSPTLPRSLGRILDRPPKHLRQAFAALAVHWSVSRAVRRRGPDWVAPLRVRPITRNDDGMQVRQQRLTLAATSRIIPRKQTA